MEILISKQDKAGLTISKFLKVPYTLLEQDSIHAENIDKKISSDLFIFATKHKGEERKNICLHVPGNWNKAEYGGKDSTLNISPSNYIKEAFLFLQKNNTTDYELTLESDHHGPSIEKSCFFIEIGSSEKNWIDEKPAKLIASCLEYLFNAKIKSYKTAIGLGGPHYCTSFNKIQANTDFSFSHICPKYQLENLNESLLQQAITKSIPKPNYIILDYKGLGKEKDNIKELLKKVDLEVLRTNQIKKDI